MSTRELIEPVDDIAALSLIIIAESWFKFLKVDFEETLKEKV